MSGRILATQSVLYNILMKRILCRDINGDVHIVSKSDLRQRTSVYGVIKTTKDILLIRDRTSSNKTWDLPGGGVEADETLLDGLKREIKEETGLDIVGKPSKICDFTEYFYDVESKTGWESTRYFYNIECVGDPIMNGNHDDILEIRYVSLPLSGSSLAPVARMIIDMSF